MQIKIPDQIIKTRHDTIKKRDDLYKKLPKNACDLNKSKHKGIVMDIIFYDNQLRKNEEDICDRILQAISKWEIKEASEYFHENKQENKT